jgi:hypothetical protein
MATPAQVILIRHAEKPIIGGETLSLRGRERTWALVPFFYGNPAVLSYGLPAAIYATKSVSTLLTVKPLAEKLALPVVDKFTSEQVQTLVKDVLNNPDYEGKMVVICWSCEEMPQIASLLGVKKPPKRWPDKTYDRMWVLSYDDESKVSLKDLPQKLLYGDSSK